MKWRLLRQEDIPRLNLEHKEWQHITLSSRLINAAPKLGYVAEEIHGAIYTSEDGLVLPVFNNIDDDDQKENQQIYFASYAGKIIAKAGTNTRGIRYDQIGEVFVQPEFRKRGVGKIVMEHLMHAPERKERNCSLFVKLDNLPAVKLYQRLGFKLQEEFRISYLNLHRLKSVQKKRER